MSIETEIKVAISDSDDFHRRLELLRPVMVLPRHFEDNFLLDYPHGHLRARRCMVRLRSTAAVSFLTFKGAPLPEGKFKVREELETTVGDGVMTLRILEGMGLEVVFRYQKYREEYTVCVPGRPESIKVLIDETPVGLYAEFEGSEEGIRIVAESMGFDESKFMRESYYSIYAEFCHERGKEPTHMVFSGGAQPT